MQIITSRFEVPDNLDAVVVLGKNLGVEWNVERVRAEPGYLSDDSRLNLEAAGELYSHWQQNGQKATDVVLSGGQTIGPAPDYPSQPEAARTYLLKKYPSIPQNRIVLDENGFDTAASAETISKWRCYQEIGLLSVGYHVDNAARAFENYGVPIACCIASEGIVAERSLADRDAIARWRAQPRIRRERQRERVRGALLRTIDRRGKLVRALTTSRQYDAPTDD